MITFDGLVAIVTGAARGMGEATARRLVECGARVVLTDVQADLGRAAATQLGDAAIFVEHDVSSEESWSSAVAAALDAFGRVDVLVNNAGISRTQTLVDTDPELFDQIVAVNQRGVYLGMRAVVEPMRIVGGGSIVNISSMAGIQAAPKLFAYSASKWAVRGMTKSAAADLARYQIRVNTVCPGVIDTPLQVLLPPGATESLVERTPLRRIGLPEEVADAVVYLASSAASFVTGTELIVDGGISA